MHFSGLALVMFMASQLNAQENYSQTAPFNLVISAPGSQINGSYLASCHEGAAIEGLCVATYSKNSGSIYNLNYTSAEIADFVLGTVGLLTWVLHGVGFNLSSPMKLSYSATSNVAVPLFTPSEMGTMIGFDEEDKMFIPSFIDDTNANIQPFKELYYRWFICETYEGYKYTTLAWVLGKYSIPQNPTCQKVTVIKEAL
ncbi:putative related to heatshock protein hsp150 [Erysiphe necator]|uniref:Putative related to heatshock protein hsp150 n=1 Tax=Uncinula necator TaxID=52586 RepID=A0A0B1P7C3_UNCNE|nr:putative related to heatshock protein hsp150 [Erysiphe necator]